MSEKTIRETHERLEEMKHTHSTKIVNEVKSDAHKDRGELLGIIDEHKKVHKELLSLVNDTTTQLEETTQELAVERGRAADLDAFIQGEEAATNGKDSIRS